MNNETIIELDFRRMWRIMQIFSISIILHILLSLIQ